MSAIEEVKQKTDITEIIGQYTTLKKAGRNLTALCPFHSEKNPSFFVYPERQSWHCFGACNTGGDVFAFIMKKEGLDFGEALRLLADRAGITLPSRIVQETKKEEKEEFYQANDASALYYHNLLLNSKAAGTARDYVEKRGFTSKTLADFQLGFSQDSWDGLKQYLIERGHQEKTLLTAGLLVEAENGRTYDRFRGKLMFPIRDIRGRVTGFGARVLDDSLPKYINSPQTPVFDKSSTLYAIDRAAADIRKQDRIIIMEGYMDVITAHQNGITNVVASMGTAITETQVNALKKLSKNLVLALDADAAGEEAMLRGGNTATVPTKQDIELSKADANNMPLSLNESNIRNYKKYGVWYIDQAIFSSDVNIVVLPKGKDPDDIIREDIKKWQDLVSKAKPFIDHTFEIVTSVTDMNSDKGRAEAVERLLPIVDQIGEPIRRAIYMQKLAKTLGITRNDLENAINRLRTSVVRKKETPTKNQSLKRILQPLLSNPREEYCLALLLQHPSLKDRMVDISPAYFENSENREIFLAWEGADDIPSLMEKLDPAVREHLDGIINRKIPTTGNDIEQRYTDCVMELEKHYYRTYEARRAETLALEAEAGGSGADVTRLQEEGIEPSIKLKELDSHRRKNRTATRR